MTGTTRRRRVGTALLAVLGSVVVGGFVAPTPALADGDPAGTVVVASGPTTSPGSVFLDAATPSIVVADTVAGLGVLGQVKVYRRDGAAGPLPSPAVSRVLATSGDLLLYVSSQDRYWYDAATGRGGPAGIATGIGPAGLFYLQQQSAVPKLTDLVRMPFDLSSRTVLGSYFWSDAPSQLILLSGPHGVFVEAVHSFTAWLQYVDGSTGQRINADVSALPASTRAGLFCSDVTATFVGCVGGDKAVVLLPVSGAPARSLGVQPGAERVVLTGWVAAWTVQAPGPDGRSAVRLRSISVNGGSPTTSTFALLKPDWIAGTSETVLSDGTSLLVSTGTSPVDAGVASVADASATPQLVVPLGAAPYGARAVAVTGNRVAWSDNATSDNPVWTRTASSVGGGITLGDRAEVAPSESFRAVTASGVRTGYFPATGATTTFAVASPWQTSFQLALDGGGGAALSGTRILYSDASPGPRKIIDVVTGALTTTDAFGDTTGRGALWGDTYTFGKPDGSVWRKNLVASTAVTQLVGPDPTAVYSPSVWGDWLVVRRFDGSRYPVHSNDFASIVNTATGATRVVDAPVLAATPAGYVTQSGTGSALTAWDGTKTVTVDGSSLAASSTLMAWIAPDQTVKAAPVPWRTSERARVFGTAAAPATVSRAAAPWVLDVPTSTPLTSCSVDLLRDATVVRSLPCRSDAASVGDAVVAWDLQGTNGTPVATGSYTWRVRAANRSGVLTRADGSERPLTGRVRATA